MTVSRRTILAVLPVGVATAATATACRGRTPARPDPDAAALAAARDTEQRLVASYAAMGDTGRHDQHLAHLTALGGVLPTASPPPSPLADPGGLARSSVAALQAAAVQAHAGHIAAVLASIAASHLATP